MSNIGVETLIGFRKLTITRAYAGSLSAVAVAVGVVMLRDYGLGDPAIVAALTIVASIAEGSGIQISSAVTLSVSAIPLALAAVLFGPGGGLVVAFGAQLGSWGTAAVRRQTVAGGSLPIERMMTWTSTAVLSGISGGLAATWVERIDGQHRLWALMAASVVATVAIILVEFVIGACTLWLRWAQGPSQLWQMARGSLAVSVALYSPLTALFAFCFRQAGALTLVFFVIPVAAAHLSFRMHRRQTQLIAELTTTNEQLAAANQRLRRANLTFAASMVRALESRDQYTAGHSAAVAVYARDIARALGMEPSQIELVHLCGLVHDIGKIGLKAEVLHKATALNDEEWAEMRRHAEIGAAMLSEVEDYEEVAAIVRSHHERMDGAGYPDRLVGEEIPLLSRVIAVADSYNAMTSDRSYRSAMQPERAIQQLVLGKGSQFDPPLVDAFLRVLMAESEDYRVGTGEDFSLDAMQAGDEDLALAAPLGRRAA
jgi:putative nucleotidyltransferase with HDIG domain